MDIRFSLHSISLEDQLGIGRAANIGHFHFLGEIIVKSKIESSGR
jgi:hypothetical protein